MSTHILSACWSLTGMSSTQKLVLISLADQANDDGVCWPSIRRMSERTCLSDRAIRDAIVWLSESGVLAVEHRYNSSNVYTISANKFRHVPADSAPPAPSLPPAPNAGTPCAKRRTPLRQVPPNHQGTVSEPSLGESRKAADGIKDKRTTDDEYFASLAEQEQKRQAEADARVKVEMTPDWQPDLKVLDDHLKFMGTKVLVSGRKVTSADLTDEITSDFRSAGHRKQERRTNHDWHGGLANYLIARIKNPKPETPKNSLPGGQNGTGEPPRHRLAFTDEKDRPKYGTYALMKPEPVKIANDPNDPVWIARQSQLRSMIK